MKHARVIWTCVIQGQIFYHNKIRFSPKLTNDSNKLFHVCRVGHGSQNADTRFGESERGAAPSTARCRVGVARGGVVDLSQHPSDSPAWTWRMGIDQP